MWRRLSTPRQCLGSKRSTQHRLVTSLGLEPLEQRLVLNAAPVATDDMFTVREDVGLVISDQPRLEITRVNQEADGLAYDPVDDVLYVSVPNGLGHNAGTITMIDPNTSTVTGSIDVAGDPGELVISPIDRSLYAVLNNKREVQTVNLDTETLGTHIVMPGTGNNSLEIRSILPLPGRGESFIVSLYQSAYNSSGGVRVYEDGQALPRQIDGSPDILAVDETGEKGYGYHIISTAFDFYELAILEDGVEITEDYPWGAVLSGFNIGKLRAAQGKLFTNRGEILSLDTYNLLGRFDGGGNFTVVPEENRLYSVETDRDDHTIRAYDLATLALVGMAEVFDVSGDAHDIVRVGTDGIAFHVEDEVVLVRSDELFGISNRGVLRNDYDADDDDLSVELVEDVEHGTLTLNTNGVFQYVPDAHFFGTDSFSYRVHDGTESSNVATVSIDVTPVNDVPVAVGDAYGGFEDQVLTVDAENGLLANDSDIEDDPLMAILVTPPADGTVELNEDGSFTYTPNPDFQETDEFTYRVFDGVGVSSPATVTIEIEPSGDPPVATDDRIVVREDVGLVISAEPVLEVLRVDQEVGGIVYDPVADDLYVTIPRAAHEEDEVIATIDPHTGQILSTVNVDGDPSYLVLSATDRVMHVVLNEDRAVQTYNLQTGNVSSRILMPGSGEFARTITDIYPIEGRPTAFIVTLEYDCCSSAGGVIVYENGVDLGRKIAGGLGSGGPSILAMGEAPNEAYGFYNKSTAFDFYEVEIRHDGVQIAKSYPWGQVLSGFNVHEIRVGDHKLFTNRGEILDLDNYEPLGSFVGGDSFYLAPEEGRFYSIDLEPPPEGEDESDTHTIYAYDIETLDLLGTATVAGVPGHARDLMRYGSDGLAFRTNDELVLVRSDELFGISSYGVLRNDFDPDGQSIQAILVDEPQHGELDLNVDGTFSYVPDQDFSGEDSFTYQVTDGLRTSDVATVTIVVEPVNDPATVDDDAYLLALDESQIIVNATEGVLANDADLIESDPLTARLVDPPEFGSVLLNTDGSFAYTAGEGFDLTDRFTYVANDGTEDSEVATVTISLDVPRIELGQVRLIPNTPNQQVPIFVTSGSQVAGVNFYLQIGDGGPELVDFGLPAGLDGPAITSVDLKSGTIFAGIPDAQIDQPGIPQVATTAIAISADGETVLADGLLATVTIDTTGFFEGTWDLLLQDVLPYAELSGPFATDFAGVPALITNGELVIEETEVVARHLLYGGSLFDGEESLPLATDKQPLLPGETASFANYSSYHSGINGLAIDIAGSLTVPTLDDFAFRVGRNNNFDDWAAAPEPAGLEVIMGGGVDGSDRIVIRWQDGAIFDEWLEVTLMASAATGLVEADVFYFGNAPGDTGDSTTNALVNATDVIATRDNKRGPFNPSAIDDPYDFNRDGLVNATDVIFARDHVTSPFTALQLISPPAIDIVAAVARVPRAPLPQRQVAVAIQELHPVVQIGDADRRIDVDVVDNQDEPAMQSRRSVKSLRSRRLSTVDPTDQPASLDSAMASEESWRRGIQLW